VNRVGDFGFLLAMLAVYRITGTLVFHTPEGTGAFDQIGAMQAELIFGFPALEVIGLLLLLGATGKSAQLPLYLWLPDAMEGPTPVSALIHAATMVTAGVYLIVRASALFGATVFALQLVAWIGIITALYAAIIAVKQYDIKRILAYSTVSQLGFMFVGVGVAAGAAFEYRAAAYASGISHLVTHAFFKALLFMGAGVVMHSLDGQLDLRKMGNLRRYLPWTFLTFIAGWYAICGLPLGAGFFSKDAILEAANHNGYLAIFWLGVLTAGLTAFYMTRMFVTVFFGSERIEMGEEGHGGEAQEHGPAGRHEPGHHHHPEPRHGQPHPPHVHKEMLIMSIPLVILAVLSLFGGLLVPFMPNFLAPVFALGAADAHLDPHPVTAAGVLQHMMALPTFASLGAAALGAAIAWFMFGPEKFARGWSVGVERGLGALQNGYEGTLHAVFVRAGTAISQVLYTLVDRRIIDRAVDGVGGLVAFFAGLLREMHTGYVRNYALLMLAGAVFVVACFMFILQMPSR
jgi:NADH-quinone oxidoreductase subunit L